MGTTGSAGVAALAVVAAVAIVALASGAAFAGDNVALFSFEPDEVEVEPGGEVTVDIVMTSHGGYGSEGIGAVSFALDYDPDVLSVTDLEAGPWLEGDGAGVEVGTEIDETAGEAWINQSREPAGEGATGTAPIATATLEAGGDADPTNATLSVTGSSVTLVNDDPQSTMVRDAIVVVDGGDPKGDAVDGSGDDPDGVTLANGDDAGAGNGADDPESEPNGDDESSLALLAGVGALSFVTVLGLAAIALRKGDPGV